MYARANQNQIKELVFHQVMNMVYKMMRFVTCKHTHTHTHTHTHIHTHTSHTHTHTHTNIHTCTHTLENVVNLEECVP